MITLKTKTEKVKVSTNFVELKCECCGKKLELEFKEDFRNAVTKARTHYGWSNRYYNDGWHHFCSNNCAIKETTKVKDTTERCKPYTELPVYSNEEIDTVLSMISARLWRASEQYVKCDKCGKQGCAQRIRLDAKVQELKREQKFYENYRQLSDVEKHKDMPRLV